MMLFSGVLLKYLVRESYKVIVFNKIQISYFSCSESIVNEHPITIYPGRASPPRKVPPRTLPGLIERHRDVCRKSIDSTNSPQEPPSFVTDGLLIIKSNQSNRPGFELEDQSKVYNVNNNSIDIPNENAIIFNNSINIEPCTSKISKKESNGCDENDFSDDSLEDASLPPPAPTQPLVPPTPSLSAPATPNKRGSIAWEININDDIEIQNTKVIFICFLLFLSINSHFQFFRLPSSQLALQLLQVRK